MIIRHYDADTHNRIANDIGVKPTLGYNQGATDFTPLLEFPDDYVLLSNGAGAAAIFHWSAPGIWQGHSMFTPEARGKAGIEAAKQMCRYMFTELGARMLWGMTPIDHLSAQMFNRLLGFRPEGEGKDAADRQVRYFVLERP